MHFKRVSFSRLFVGGRRNINPFIAGGKEIDAFDDFSFPSSFQRPFFAYLYNSRHTTSSPVAGKGGKEEEISFLRGMRRACSAWQTVEGRRDCVLAFLHENWGGRGEILLKPTLANYIEVTFLHLRYLKRRILKCAIFPPHNYVLTFLAQVRIQPRPRKIAHIFWDASWGRSLHFLPPPSGKAPKKCQTRGEEKRGLAYERASLPGF